MRRCTGLLLLVTLSSMFALPAHADECDVTWSSVGDDFVALIEAPFHMTSEEAAATLGVAALVGASIVWWDEDVDLMVQRRPDSLPYHAMHQLSRIADWYGESVAHAFLVYAGVTGAVALGGVIADDDYVLNTAAIMAESGVFTFGLDVAVKLVIGRKRPYTGDGPAAFDFLVSPGDVDTQSFLSGHTAGAFALAGSASGRHPYWYVQVPSYLFAVAAGAQRIDSRKHWLSDVISGAFFGYAISEFLVDRYECDDDAGDDAAGPTMSLTFRF
jgi:membrane-associated phospholipid phosphatase